MKRFWKTGWMLALAALLAVFPACGRQDTQDTQDAPGQSLYAHGLELISLMREMAGSEVYLSVYSDNEEIQSILQRAAAGAQAQPQAVYRIRRGEADLFQWMGISLEGLSQRLQQVLEEKTASAAVTQINAMGGSTTLAAASLCTAQKLFVSNEEMEQSEIYLYVYESALPAAATFTKGEGGAVLATGMFVLYDDFSADSLEEVRQVLAGLGVTVEEITP